MSKFLKIVVNIILLCAILVAGGLLIPPFAGVTTVVVDDVSMDTNLAKGSVTYALKKDSVEQGDKVLVQVDQSQYVYEVASATDNTYVLEDKLSTDGGTLEQTTTSQIKKVILTVPFIGYISMALKSTEGLIIVGLAVVFVIILFILAEIWKKDDDEEEDEEDGDDAESGEVPQKQLSRRERKKAKKLAAEAEAAKLEAEEDEKAKRAAEQAAKKKVQPETDADIVKAEPETTGIPGQTETGSADAYPDNDALFEETQKALAAEVAEVAATAENTESDTAADTDAERKLAIPVYSKEELLERAKAAGEEPEIVEDEVSGVTFFDYSDIL
jgi:hypothetical protein